MPKIAVFLFFWLLLSFGTSNILLLGFETSSRNIRVSEMPVKEKNSVKSTQNTANNYLPIFNQAKFDELVTNLDLSLLKKTIIRRRKSDDQEQEENNNRLTAGDWKFHPQLFQKIYLKILAEEINFLDLLCEFTYFDDYQKVKVKISDRNEEDFFVEKIYKIEIEEN